MRLSTDLSTLADSIGPALDAQVDWVELLEGEPPEPDWLVEPLLLSGRSYALVGGAGAGKSLLAFELCCSLAAGRPALGSPARPPKSVLYVDLENTAEDLSDRARAMGFEPGELSNLHYLLFPDLQALDTKTGGQQLVALATYWQAELVVLDTVSRMVEGKENDSDTYLAMYRYALVELKRDGVAVVRIDHLGKDADKGARGSSAKSGDVDGIWQLTKDAETPLVYLERTKQRANCHPAKVVLRRETEPLRHAYKAGVVASVELRNADEVLADHPTAWLTVQQVAELAGANPDDRSAVEKVRRQLARLVKSDQAETRGKPSGRGGPKGTLYRHVPPGSPADHDTREDQP